MLRVIAGKYRRRRLQTLPGEATRPMLDRVRETLFNVLRGRIEGKTFVDLYAGTGAVGIEALSRGAARAVFVESAHEAVRVIRENLKTLDAEQDADVRETTVAAALASLQGDVYFVGPPYVMEQEYAETLGHLGESAPTLVVAQHAGSHALAERYGRLERVRMIRHGKNVLSFYEPAREAENPAREELGRKGR
jgi:16S rRNA (guanine(966)-N(2))-methyltransferase RsmD